MAHLNFLEFQPIKQLMDSAIFNKIFHLNLTSCCRVRVDRQERRRPDPLRRVRRLGPLQEPRPRGRRGLKI